MINNYILQIDTATEICSVSISIHGNVLDKIEANEPNIHASKLTLFIDDLLRRNQLSYQDLVAVAVSKGPGSYTGLRIGVSTAKGLCYALEIPLIAINTLESMYHGFISKRNETSNATLFVPMLDARRMEVYLMIKDFKGSLIKDTAAVVVEESTFADLQSDTIYLFGSGASKLKDLFSNNDVIHIDTSYVHSSAYMSQLAFEKFEKADFEDLIYFEPFYLKEFIATTPKGSKL